MFQEKKKNMSYGVICFLFCFFWCAFAVECLKFPNTQTKTSLQQDVGDAEPTATVNSFETSESARSPLPEPTRPRGSARSPLPEPTSRRGSARSPLPQPTRTRGSAQSPLPEPTRPRGSAGSPLPEPTSRVGSEEAKVSSSVQAFREREPSSYALKIEAFNTLANSINEKYESRPFAAGGYNWTLIMYPKGNRNDGGSGYISLYVQIDNSSLTSSQEVYADLRFFVYNKNERKYLTLQETNLWRFSLFKTTWGFSQVVAFNTFNDPKNGYLYDGGHCEFGVDVVVSPRYDKSELFSVIEKFDRPVFSWTLTHFSKLDKYYYDSSVFAVGGRNWNLKVYPSGAGIAEGNSLSLYLCPWENLKPYEKVYFKGQLRILDQSKSNHLRLNLDVWFTANQNGPCWGYTQFVSFEDLKNPSKGYIVNDSLKLEVEFQTLSSIQYFPRQNTQHHDDEERIALPSNSIATRKFLKETH